jgi:hypothetical protein
MVYIKGHLAAQGIYLPNQVPFGCASDIRIARHHRDGVQIDGEQDRAHPQSRGGQGGFAARMASTYNRYVPFAFITHEITPKKANAALLIFRRRTL